MTLFKMMLIIALTSPFTLNDEDPVLDDYPEKEATTTTELEHEENGCLGLNYHRVRDFGPIENIFTFLSNSRELTIYSVSTEAFEYHMEWLVEQDATFVTMAELIEYKEEGTFPDQCVWVSFDDMDTTIYENAHPVLVEHNIPATGFVITGEVGNTDFNNIALLNQTELNQMVDSGIWEFSTHTHKLHHLDGNDSLMVNTSEENLDEDIRNSINYFNEEFNHDINAIAYPFGQSNDSVVNVMEENDIEYGFSLEEREIRAESHPYYIPRVLVSEDAFDTLVRTWEGFDLNEE